MSSSIEFSFILLGVIINDDLHMPGTRPARSLMMMMIMMMTMMEVVVMMMMMMTVMEVVVLTIMMMFICSAPGQRDAPMQLQMPVAILTNR